MVDGGRTALRGHIRTPETIPSDFTDATPPTSADPCQVAWQCGAELCPAAVPTRVVASLNNFVGDHCVDIFVRDDGTFGFEEYRRDPEDMRGWFPLHRYSNQVFATGQEAQVQAKATVAWMASDSQ